MQRVADTQMLFTGGSGLMGSEYRKRLPRSLYPTSSELNVVDPDAVNNYLNLGDVRILVHAAAFTSPPEIDKDPMKALEVNILGTLNVVRACIKRDIRLIYISTDYVFDGEKGLYCESDPVFPVNKYAWSKLGGECAVRMWFKSLIIRTSFGPAVFPFPKAFVDQWTSREDVAKVVEMTIPLLRMDITGVIHVGGARKSVYEYAKSLDPCRDIGKLKRSDVSFCVPRDTSLNVDYYNSIMAVDRERL